VPGFESLEARTGWYLVFYCLFQLFMSVSIHFFFVILWLVQINYFGPFFHQKI
jgi:hypothetical protein